MINIKTLSVKNFLSVGNVTQAINFDSNPLTLVLGENLDQGGEDTGNRNGTGKSTILNALSYSLFGQALTNIKKGNLINKSNSKNMLVTVNFEKDGVLYRIERGRSPNILKFYVNNQEIVSDDVDESQGDSRKTQESINNLLEMSHDMFKHIIALNTYSEPFLSMRASDQREIIEQLLGITVLSQKAEQLGKDIRASKDAISAETLRINAIQSSNEKIQASIDSLKKRQRAWNSKHRKDIENLETAISRLEKLDIEAELVFHEQLQNWLEKNNTINAYQKEWSTLEPTLFRADRSVEKLVKDIADLDDAVCYTCGQALHEDKKTEIASQKQKELEDARSYAREIDAKCTDVTLALAELGELEPKPITFYDSVKEAYEHRNNLESLRQSLLSKQQDEDPYATQIDELNNTAIQSIDWTTVNELTKYREHQEFLLKLLTNKDSFIRKKIIDQNLNYLNSRLTHYLGQLGLPHQVKFMNDLNVEITQLGQDLDFDNLSRGERNRLILGLSFAFRDVWESLYQNINILFIDELIDSGLDQSGVENSMVVLKKMARERNKNIFIISHRDELIQKIDNILKVVKQNGFTEYFVDDC